MKKYPLTSTLIAAVFFSLTGLSFADEKKPCDTSAKPENFLVFQDQGRSTGPGGNAEAERSRKFADFEANYKSKNSITEGDAKRYPHLKAWLGTKGTFSYKSEEKRVGSDLFGNAQYASFYSVYFTPTLTLAEMIRIRCEKITGCLAEETRQEEIETLSRMADTLGCR